MSFEITPFAALNLEQYPVFMEQYKRFYALSVAEGYEFY